MCVLSQVPHDGHLLCNLLRDDASLETEHVSRGRTEGDVAIMRNLCVKNPH